MDFFDVISQRRSIRKYKDDPVPRDMIEQIMETARLAPSWHNNQCWRFIVVTDPESKEAVHDAVSDENPCKKGLKQAPVAILACASPEDSGRRDGKDYYLVDVGIALEHVCLAAKALGLGTCWIGVIDEKLLREKFGVPENFRVVAMTPLGYPDKDPSQRPRKDLSELAFREKWGSPLTDPR